MCMHDEYERSTIDVKIDLLKDFRILKWNAHHQEKAVREILAECKTDTQLDIKVRDLVLGKETIQQFIGRHKK